MKTHTLTKHALGIVLLCAFLASALLTSCGDEDDDSAACTLDGLSTEQQSLVLGLLSGDCGVTAQKWVYQSATSGGTALTGDGWGGFHLTLNKDTVGGKAALSYKANLPATVGENAEYQRVWPTSGKLALAAEPTTNQVSITRYSSDGVVDGNISNAQVVLNEDKSVTISFTVAAASSARALGTPTGDWSFTLTRATE